MNDELILKCRMIGFVCMGLLSIEILKDVKKFIYFVVKVGMWYYSYLVVGIFKEGFNLVFWNVMRVWVGGY